MIATIKAMPGIRTTALCDRYPVQLDRAAALLGDPDVACFTDHCRMLREAPIDAVYVAVEPENCAARAVECLEAGKHVLSEVPMAFELDDVWRIVLAVERSGGLIYMLGEQMRCVPVIRAWRQMVAAGELGKIVYAEGQYLHGLHDDRFYMDPDTGDRLTLEQARRHPAPRKSRFWALTHPILYLPHELSPLLHILDDRVVSVSCMGTRRDQSYIYDFLPRPDFETALMHTAGDTILRLSCCFTIMQICKEITGRHWYSLMGTRGSVETHRSDHDRMKRLLAGDDFNETPEEMWWDHDARSTPAEALRSEHGGADYWLVRNFADAVSGARPPEMDVYLAAETAAPAILAARSAEQDGVRLTVPDFRPGAGRAAGQAPAPAG